MSSTVIGLSTSLGVWKVAGSMRLLCLRMQCDEAPLDHAAELRAIVEADHQRLRILGLVRSLALPDCWVGAGFLRTAAWDALHGRAPTPPTGDVDVIWFDPARAVPDEDQRLAMRLREQDGSIAWSVRNQARMHLRNGDAPYASATDAMRYWPETATAIAIRRTEMGSLELASPYGLSDLFALTIKPTPYFTGNKRQIVVDRVHRKGWLHRWPLLRQVEVSDHEG